jgi:hypothetical protein
MDTISESPVPTESEKQISDILTRSRELLKQDGKKIKSDQDEQEIVYAKYKLFVPKNVFSAYTSDWIPKDGGSATLEIQNSPSEGTTTLGIRFGENGGKNSLIFHQERAPEFKSERLQSHEMEPSNDISPDIHDFWILTHNFPIYLVDS